jgi:hypothetical protein
MRHGGLPWFVLRDLVSPLFEPLIAFVVSSSTPLLAHLPHPFATTQASMSDEEGGSRKSGYRLEYASTARAGCKGALIWFIITRVNTNASIARSGPKPCSGMLSKCV